MHDRSPQLVVEHVAGDGLAAFAVEIVEVRQAAAEDDHVGVENRDDVGERAAEAIDEPGKDRLRRPLTAARASRDLADRDPDAALGFYRDTLGLTVQDEVENEGFRWITLVTDTQPDIKIVLSQPHAGRSKEDGDVLAALLAKGELPGPFFRTDDLSETFDKTSTAPGVEVLSEPADQFWGVRDAAVRDPAGNMIRIEQG